MLSICGEWLYTHAVSYGDLDMARQAAQIWPLDVRFRGAQAEIVYRIEASAIAVPVLQEFLQSEPYNAGIRTALILHLLRLGRQPEFAREAARLMVEAPHSALATKLRGSAGQ